jgi:hypothetical protein
VLRTRAPLSWKASSPIPSDLHVLGLPLAFILSQDQTLHCKMSSLFTDPIINNRICKLYLFLLQIHFLFCNQITLNFQFRVRSPFICMKALLLLPFRTELSATLHDFLFLKRTLAPHPLGSAFIFFPCFIRLKFQFCYQDSHLIFR